MRTLYLAGLMAVFALLPISTRLFAAGDPDDYWMSISKHFVIGGVTLQLTNEQIHVTGSNLNVTLDWPMPLVQDYVCAVRNPFAKPKMEDGFVQNDANFRLLKDDEDFKRSAFPRFAFFTKRPTTIGLLAGHAAANGGSVQKLLLVDVETGKHLLLRLENGVMPVWRKHKSAVTTGTPSAGKAGS
jgi:hypothetical protein